MGMPHTRAITRPDLPTEQNAAASEGGGDGHALQRYVQILGTDAGDCCPSVLVVTESARYLFNAGDGLQVCLSTCTCHTLWMDVEEHVRT